MAISTSNIRVGTSSLSGSIIYNLWGTIGPVVNISLNQLANTINDTTNPKQFSSFSGLSASFSRTPTSLYWPHNDYSTKIITITTNTGWYYSKTGSSNFILANSSANASLGNGNFGGNGSIYIVRIGSTSDSGTITLYYCNGSGGVSNLTVGLSSTA